MRSFSLIVGDALDAGFGKANLDRAALGAEHLVFQGCNIGCIEGFVCLAYHHAVFGEIVDIGEIDVRAAFFGRRHPCDNHVDVAGCERCEQTVEVHVLDLEFHAEVLRNLTGDRNVESDDRILSVDLSVEFVGRVVGRRSEHDFLGLGNSRKTGFRSLFRTAGDAGGHQCERGYSREYSCDFFHLHTSILYEQNCLQQYT
ncbi:MAG: hypothetical protein BWY39_00007 [Spirochaetes bacterium ADurb.Bin269]|nr:MAG: hypothetical protein BWY39_00007 [Spirochaetes bacterium ADurb.Bin269]